jgi:hypothetical protein
MFLRSVLGGIAALGHWQVLLGLIVLVGVNVLVFYALAGSPGSGVRRPTLLIDGVIRPGVHALLLAFFLAGVAPLVMGAGGTVPLTVLVQHSLTILLAAAAATGLAFGFSLVRGMGPAFFEVPGAATFVQGVVIFRIVAGDSLSAVSGREVVYPGFIASVGYLIVGVLFVVIGFLLLTTIKAAFRVEQRGGRQGTAPVVLSWVNWELTGLLPVFMYVRGVGLALGF